MKRIFIIGSLAASVIVYFASSCKKKEADTDATSATDNSICEGEFNRVVPATNSIAIGDPGVNGNRIANSNGLLSNCPTDSIAPGDTTYPITLYIKYGSTGCQGPDGKTRKCTLRCVFDTAWDALNPTMTIYLENYYVDDVHFEGTIAVSKNTTSRTFTQVMTDGKCSKSSWVITYECNRSMTWVAGYNTLADPTDDVFLFNGYASGVDRNGTAYDVDIISSIEKRGNCKYITRGSFEVTPEGKETRTVDFGDGTCDNKATLKIKNSTFNFTLL